MLAAYRSKAGAYDELFDERGSVRPQWAYLIDAFEKLGHDETARRGREAQRLLRENGVTYNVYDDSPQTERAWPLDPVPAVLTSAEWQVLEQALVQRAELLELILADLYGAQNLLRRGLLPPQAIFAHNGFLRPCAAMAPAGGRHLPLYAADLARTPNGSFCVLGDRTQAPSGAGYALENRTILSRVLPSVFRDSHVHRLPSFFRRWRTLLNELAPTRDETAHIVLLTPGAGSETFFEHAYLASSLGCTLAQGDDLVVRDQRVWLRTLEGLRAVDVILRRVDASYCDPLELKPDSLLGTPGLLQAARQGRVAIVNPLGSSAVENPALMPFLPQLARELLGEDLRLACVPTWWCGNGESRAYVLDNLDRLVVKPIFPHASDATHFGYMLGSAARARLTDLINAQPHLFVAQERLELSTTPVLTVDGLAPRAMVLRSFLVAEQHGYSVLPGSLCRVAPSGDTLMVSNQRGGVSKDVWILASEPEQRASQLVAADRALAVERGGEAVSGRVADNLFWAGRYSARAESVARMLREVIQRILDLEDAPGDPTVSALLRAVTRLTETYPGFVGTGSPERLVSPEPELLSVLLDQRRSGSLGFCLLAFARTARSVRDRFSSETWKVIGALDRAAPTSLDLQSGFEHLDRTLILLAAFAGLSADSISRGQRWRFLEIGRRLEKAHSVLALLRAFRPDAGDVVPWEAVLAIADASMTYRRRYRSAADPSAVLDLLVDDDSNPRSLQYQLVQLDVLIDGLAGAPGAPHGNVEAQALIRDAIAELGATAVLESGQENRRRYDKRLDDILELVHSKLTAISDRLAETYFTRGAGPRQLVRLT